MSKDLSSIWIVRVYNNNGTIIDENFRTQKEALNRKNNLLSSAATQCVRGLGEFYTDYTVKVIRYIRDPNY